MLSPLWNDNVSHTWTPWRELRVMQRNLDKLFDGYRPSLDEAAAPVTSVPSYDVEETPTAFLVRVEVPGVKPEDLKVSSKDGRLDVNAETKHGERSRKFRVSFTLPNDIDESRLEASLEHGVLALALPKASKAEAREIPVKFAKSPNG